MALSLSRGIRLAIVLCAGFFGALHPAEAAKKSTTKKAVAKAVTKGVTIESPAQGAIARPGSWVVVKVRPDASLKAVRASMLVGTWEELVSVVDEVPPFDLVLPIEQKWSGPLRLMWSVQSARGKLVGSGELLVNVVPLELPVSIAVTDPVRMVAGSHANNPQERINVRGTYADGTVRDVAGQDLGTSFHSSDARVVSVNGEGFLTARSPGRAVVTVKNGALSKAVPIDVQPGPKPTLPTMDVTSHVDVPVGSVRVDERSSRLAQ